MKPIYHNWGNLLNPPDWLSTLPLCTTLDMNFALVAGTTYSINYVPFAAAVKAAAAKPTILVLDIEQVNPEQQPVLFSDYLHLARQLAPHLRIGHYGFPVRDNTPSKFDAVNAGRKWIIDQHDFVVPSLYSTSNKEWVWRKSFIGVHDQCKKHHGDKPAYAFVWPYYHPYMANVGIPYPTFVGADMWLEQLQLAYDLFDGLILWQVKKETPPDDPIITSTKQFLDSLTPGLEPYHS